MVAEVNLSLNAKDSTFVVPSSALMDSAEGQFVIKVDENQKALRIPVSVGRDSDGFFEVFGDLKLKEKLVLEASEEIKDGDFINE